MEYGKMHSNPFRVVQQGDAITFYDASGEVVDLLVVLSQTIVGPVDLLIDDFAVRLEGAILHRIDPFEA